MTIHLIKDKSVSGETFTAIYDLLSAVPGTIQFKCDARSIVSFDEDEIIPKYFLNEDQFGKKEIPPRYDSKSIFSKRIFPTYIDIAQWSSFFNKCDRYKKTNNIPDDEMVLILSDRANEYNWFAALDNKNPNNGFIHTADWELYLSCPSQFPIAYEVIALFLHRFSFDIGRSLVEQAHVRAIGCVNDLCMEKKDIILKMRTADICGSCMTRLKQNLPMSDILHALDLMKSLREKMLYAQNFKQHMTLSEIVLENRTNRIFLPDFGNIEIKLRPLEKTLYIFFLRHPQGLYMTELSDYREELLQIYEQISNTGTREDMMQKINNLVNVLSNSASEKMSVIKRVFEEAIGPDLAKHYYIQGGNGERKGIKVAGGR